jgi:hypothetical protein
VGGAAALARSEHLGVVCVPLSVSSCLFNRFHTLFQNCRLSNLFLFVGSRVPGHGPRSFTSFTSFTSYLRHIAPFHLHGVQ